MYGLRSCSEQSVGNGYQLVGSTEVTNDGEVEATHEITFTWWRLYRVVGESA
jgi:hypothetical protein